MQLAFMFPDPCPRRWASCWWGLVLDSNAARRCESRAVVNVTGRWWLYPCGGES